jgi:hypothetical protein
MHYGETDLCRAFFPRARQSFFSFFPCITNPPLEKIGLRHASGQNALQTNIFAVCFSLVHGKVFFSFSFLASQIHRSKKWLFVVRPDKTRDKQISLRMFFPRARQSISSLFS